jgi:hypothetical protein
MNLRERWIDGAGGATRQAQYGDACK